MKTKHPHPKIQPISAHAISKRIGRHPSSVLDAIRRLGIKPAVEATVNFYREEDIPVIEAGMRRKNREVETQG